MSQVGIVKRVAAEGADIAILIEIEEAGLHRIGCTFKVHLAEPMHDSPLKPPTHEHSSFVFSLAIPIEQPILPCTARARAIVTHLDPVAMSKSLSIYKFVAPTVRDLAGTVLSYIRVDFDRDAVAQHGAFGPAEGTAYECPSHWRLRACLPLILRLPHPITLVVIILILILLFIIFIIFIIFISTY